MTGKRLGKVLLVWLCIITLTMPFCSEVLAAVTALTGNENSGIVLQTIAYREGGRESSTGRQMSYYDETSYAYKVGGTSVLKIVRTVNPEDNDDESVYYGDTFYCVNAERSFSVTGNGYNYSKVANDFAKLSDSEVSAWASSVGISEANYNSLIWILNNLYSKNLDTSYKATYLANAFANRIANDGYTVDFVREYLTDDIIEVVQQWAIWYFTNGSNSSNSFFREIYARESLPSVEATKITGVDPDTHVPTTLSQDLDSTRKGLAEDLFDYLIRTAKANSSSLSSNSARKITLWTGNREDGEPLQPVVLITENNDEFDLSLKKFVSGINGVATDRAPSYDVTPLNNGENDATYTVNKTPLKVETGDLVTFTLRVYNEGDIDGYADLITDYIPEGLGFLPQYNGNSGWGATGDAYLTDKLLDTSKINLSDFTGVTNINDIVVKTSGKVSNSSLSNSNEANLISAFNGTRLDYKDVPITFVVLATDSISLKNIAAITGESDKDKNPITTDRGPDKDSSPLDDIDPNNYPEDGVEDDDDYDVVDVNKKVYDLALRKYIVSVNGNATSGRTPTPSAKSLEDLAAGRTTTAEYYGVKTPINVKRGDTITYEFRVYNEGDFNANMPVIVDYLPEGLTLKSTVIAGYTVTQNGRAVILTPLTDIEIPAFDKANKDLSYGKVQIECQVTGELSEGTTLTNVAEIKTDREDNTRGIGDSKPETIDPNDITNDWTGNNSTYRDKGDDLSDPEYYYKGIEDDDDFEKVMIAGFDLSLKKFVSKVNSKDQNRAPSIDVTPLKNGMDDAKYTTTKTPLTVNTGDVVTFTLRVYNEGAIDGYAEQITEYIPEGLGFLQYYNTNNDNKWGLVDDGNVKSVKLSEIKNGTDNLKIEDFVEGEYARLEDVDVVLGKAKFQSTKLASSRTSEANKISAFNGERLDYKDVQMTLIVVTEDALTLKNIAAITGESKPNPDYDGADPNSDPTVPVDTDRGPGKDSSPLDDIDPDNYPENGIEDDDDYDVIKTDKKNFDLALQKFASKLNDTEITDRVPAVSVTDGKVKYTHPKAEPLTVGNGDLIEYTIRVYNEGEIDGYAAEIGDDIPTGLVFLPENDTNKAYGWKMYDKSGKETTDVNQAVQVKTAYLSKEASNDNLIKAFDGSTLVYRDVKLVFKVDEKAIERTTTTEKRTLINTAEITKHTDKDGKDIPDVDSTPGDGKGPDDLDQEKVYVKYFDLALEKTLNKAIVTTNGEKTEVVGNQLKIEIHRKNINSTSIQFVYTIKVTNQGEIEGYATEVTDYIPDGLSFDASANPDWTKVSDKIIKTESLAKTLLKPGESAEVQVILDWTRNSDNIGRFINVAEISEDWNPYDSDDVDSTPNNLISTEDDQDEAAVWVGVVTGLGDQPYLILTTVVLVILATGVILIKKYVL